jgi:septum formation protein
MLPMLVLASESPRRQELLRNAGIPFEVQPAHIPEDVLHGEGAKECAERLARDKALSIARQRPQDIVLGADTVVVVDGELLGKPADAADARRMLRLLSGRKHEVITGVCLVASGVPSISSETTVVTVNKLTDQEISDYVTGGEPMDKAGAYAIQGIASRWIPRIEGDYSNVVGLPVALVFRMLREAAVSKVTQPVTTAHENDTSRDQRIIVRMWRARATAEKSCEYVDHATKKVFPALRAIDGFRGAYLLRRTVEDVDGIELAVLTIWESMEAIRRFAGVKPERAVVEPEARAVLSSFDEVVTHFEVVHRSERGGSEGRGSEAAGE